LPLGDTPKSVPRILEIAHRILLAQAEGVTQAKGVRPII
jgi:hypothetical protein